MTPEKSPAYRFGNFEVAPVARTLKRDEAVIPLSRRSFDLLYYFVRNSGRILSKDELLREIWPDTFVDENSLAKSISVLRKALGDGTGENAYILTLPGRGYQFAVPVETVSGPIALQVAGADALPAARDSESSAIGVVHQRRTVRTLISEVTLDGFRVTPSGWTAFGLFALLVLSTVAGGGFLTWKHFHPKPQSVAVVLADFENTTGDKDFDSGLMRAFQIELEQSPFIELLPREVLNDTLMQMQQKPDTALTAEMAKEVCERNNAQAVLSGSISNFAGSYLLMVNASSCVTGKNLAGYKEQVASKTGVLAALDAAASRIRKQLGESASSLERFQTPIAQATTSSLDALRAYTQALNASDHGDAVAEQGLFERAIALDPNFASAYKGLSAMYYNRQDFLQGIALIQKAYDLREHATERERLSIEIAYNTYGSWDWEAAIASLRLYNQIYPGVAENWFGLSSLYSKLGEYQQAIEAGEYGMRLAPHSGTGAEILARAYMRANRFADAKRVAQTAIAEGKGRWGTHRILFEIAFAEQDAEGMKTEGEWGFSHGEMGQSLADLGFVAASEGKLQEAVKDFKLARQEGLHSGDTGFADVATLFLAGILEQYGYPGEAAAALKEMKNIGDDPGTAAAFKAELGDLGPAQQEVARMSASSTRNTLNLYFDLPMLRAMLDLKSGKAEQALQDLEPARKYEMRDYGVPILRARAETEAKMLDKAEADYRLVLANPGLDPIWPGHSTVHLMLARVLARQGKGKEARGEYESFLNEWKDGDAQVPLLVQAREEYGKLGGR